MHGVMAEEIKNVYVLGHSMGLPDIEYFAFLADATRSHKLIQPDSENSKVDSQSINELHNRLQYAISHIGYNLAGQNIQSEQKESVVRKYSQEQSSRNQEFQRMFIKLLGKVNDKDVDQSETKTVHRKNDAAWHISFYSDKDRQWAETLMKELGCERVTLYSTIDECLAPFKIHRL